MLARLISCALTSVIQRERERERDEFRDSFFLRLADLELRRHTV